MDKPADDTVPDITAALDQFMPQIRFRSRTGWLMIALIIIGMFLDGVSIFLILLPVLIPIAQAYHWDLTWFGVLLTMKIAIGQFTPPLAVNLMVSCRIAGVRMEDTVRWVGWMLLSMFLVMVAVIAWPELATALPRHLGY